MIIYFAKTSQPLHTDVLFLLLAVLDLAVLNKTLLDCLNNSDKQKM